jgi:hypothetical protein
MRGLYMLALTDAQFADIMETAKGIDPERRDVFLQRVAAMLRLRGRFSDDDVVEVARLATCGLVQGGFPIVGKPVA